MTIRPFFGGAITCDVPTDWRDISSVRQVPDHQECWQSAAGHVLVVEVLQRHDEVTDEQAATFFFRDLAEANGIPASSAEDSTQFTVANEMPSIGSNLPPDATVHGGIGRQLVAQGRDTDIAGNPRQLEARWVRVDLCVIRLPNVTSEILITLTSPQMPLAEFTMGFHALFAAVIQSFRIADWTLFG